MGFFNNLFKKKDLPQAHLGISSTESKRDLKVYSFDNYKGAYPELYKALANPSIKIIAIGISPLSEQRGLIIIKHPKLGFIFEGSDIGPMVAKTIFANISGLYENKDIGGRLVKLQTSNELHEERRKAMGELISEMNKSSYGDIQKAAKLQPNNPFFQDIKNKEEFLIRNKISSLAALMAGDDIDWLEACKEIIQYADKGLKINPDSAYLLYFRGRSKGDIGLLKEGLEDLNKAIKFKPDYSDAFVERGYIKQKTGDFSGAKNDYDKGVELDLSLQQQVNSYLNKEPKKRKNNNEDDIGIIIEPGKIKKDKLKPLLIHEDVLLKTNEKGIPKIYGLSNIGKLKGGVTCKFYHEKCMDLPNLYKAEPIVILTSPDHSKIIAEWMNKSIKTQINKCLIIRYESTTKDSEGLKIYMYIMKIDDKYFHLSNENAENFISTGIKSQVYP